MFDTTGEPVFGSRRPEASGPAPDAPAAALLVPPPAAQSVESGGPAVPHPTWAAADRAVRPPVEPANDSRHAPDSPAVGRGGGRGFRAVVAAAMLAATLASAATLGVVAVTGPWQTAVSSGATPAATANAQLVSTTTTSSDDTTAIARATASTVTIETQSTVAGGFFGGSAQASGVGSGVILTADGLILTNNHVIDGASTITVLLPDGSTAPATVVATDSTHDLAVIRAKATGLTPATLATSTTVEIGQTVYAIGTPLGEYADSVTRGIVSATQRTVTVTDTSTRATKTLSGLIQTDAAINAGNSGGPLIDSQGAVVGIATAGSQSAEGIGFAIPIGTASALVAQAEASAA